MPQKKRMGRGQIGEPSATYCRTGRKVRSRQAGSALVTSRLDPRSVPVVRSAKALPGFRLQIAFEDGATGQIDLGASLSGPVFEPLRDESFFAQVRVDDELGTTVWPNGADFAPEFLYEQIRNSGQ